ncbi:Dienelactone hydrolase family [Alloalcanivorax dieselolei B5]|uniref:Dienelactone hydrolase family n=1 Tax=Alcanivorax dieselolei (strain DSM 16502 / CGMCC 1.3690 / MCCC 1A00001 / B-5) TaxID=930169 RepID=K0CG39_ALCDB|nr:dienelactone hydrolase family protein [Alloalcanivorax dieselolei]AFT71603.1 Dienelactone hydrolase family [Alloalcanivorax dieselolei B5]GGJ89554.1 carboxymethylenebutenolidase [Alloalcanivorax dieselolei]
MNAEAINLSLPDGHPMRARWIVPDRNNGLGAGIIVIHDIFGFTPDLQRIAERLASAGYPVLAPDLYDQAGGKASCVVRTLRDHERGRGFAFQQLETCRQWLLQQRDAEVTKVGVMGFCMGGRFALLFAARAPIQVVAPFYGGVPKKAESLHGICPVVGGWGRKDLIYGNHGDRLAGHLTRLDVPHDIRTYDHAGHSYMNDHQTFTFKRLGWYSPLRSRHDPDAAEDSWRRVLSFFEKTLRESEPALHG